VADRAIVALGVTLARDPVFRHHMEAIRAGDQTVAGVAAVYFPCAPKRRRIMEALIQAALNPLPDGEGVHLWFAVEMAIANAPRGSCWVDEPLAPGDPQRALQERARESIAEGSSLIARLGAPSCLLCGSDLATNRQLSRRSPVVKRWEYVRYCDSCEESGDAERERESHDGLIRRVIDDVGLSLGIDDAASSRRIKRTRSR